MRKLLFDQVQVFRDKRKNEKDLDNTFMNQLSAKAQADIKKEKENQIEKKKMM